MIALIRNVLLATCLSGLITLAEPYFRMSLYTGRLAAQPVPERLKIPVDRVRAGALRDSWHAPRTAGRRHEGIDIFAPQGTPVRATTEGVVAQVGSSRRGGLVVWVIGPGGQRHYYAHLARFADVHRGQRIKAGTVLGYVGNTGNARGAPPHLHYGIYARGGAINPFLLLRG
jgi:murein DD-endopeptidase MepM/ murein hydrolase activator NlpD